MFTIGTMRFEAESNPAYPLIQILQQLVEFISGLEPEQFSEPGSRYYTSSAGAHIRHILDHASTLVTGLTSGKMEYDVRDRGTPIEKNPAIALAEIERIITNLSTVTKSHMTLPAQVRILLSPDGPIQDFKSSFGREVGFVISHSIHHNAILSAMKREWNGKTDGDFGVAPSTIAYQRQQSCAR